MKAELFELIADKLNADLTELAWIDWDWGQLEVPTENYPVQFDAVLISFPDIQWQQGSGNVEYGNTVVQVRIAVDVYDSLHTADGEPSPAVGRNYAKEKMKLEDRVYKCLKNFQGSFFSGLQRVSSGEERRDDGIKVFVQTYMTNMVDGDARKVMNEMNAGLIVSGSWEQ